MKNRGPQVIDIEPDGESGGFCDCCGTESRTIWGYAYIGGNAVACYFLQWTVGASLEAHPANFDLIYGNWEDGASEADRCAVSMIHFEQDGRPGSMVIDASERPVARSPLVGHVLKREEVIDTELAGRAFDIFDAVITSDPRLS